MREDNQTLIITIEVKYVYGKPVVYPRDTEAELFAAIAGTQTLTSDTLTRVLELGYTIEHRAANGTLITCFDADNVRSLLELFGIDTATQRASLTR